MTVVDAEAMALDRAVVIVAMSAGVNDPFAWLPTRPGVTKYVLAP